MGDDADEAYEDRDYRDDLPAGHPLQFCHPRLYPFGEARELRAYFEKDLALARTLVRADIVLLGGKLGSMRKYGYSLHAADQARMQQMVHEFVGQLLRVLDNARVIDSRRDHLRLVASQKPTRSI